MHQLLEVNLKVDEEASNLKISEQLAPIMAEFPGLVWQVWINNRSIDQINSLCIFSDEISLQAYINGPLASIKSRQDLKSIWHRAYSLDQAGQALALGAFMNSTQPYHSLN